MKMDLKKSKNNVLQEIVKKNAEEGNSRVIKNIPIEDIEENPMNEEIFGISDIEVLASVIKSDGFIGSINVIKMPNGKYQIFSGHRRYRAMQFLGAETIPCTVEEGLTKTLLMRKLLNSNIQTRHMTPLNYARAVREYEIVLEEEKFKGNKREELARIFSTSGSTIYRYQAINRLIPELQELTDSFDFPYAAFESATGLSIEQQKDLNSRIRKYMEEFPTSISKTTIQQFITSIIDKEKKNESDKHWDKVTSVSVNNSMDKEEKQENSEINHDTHDNEAPSSIPFSFGAKMTEFQNNQQADDSNTGAQKQVQETVIPQINYGDDEVSRQRSIDYDILRACEIIKNCVIGEVQISDTEKITNMLKDLKSNIAQIEKLLK